MKSVFMILGFRSNVGKSMKRRKHMIKCLHYLYIFHKSIVSGVPIITNSEGVHFTLILTHYQNKDNEVSINKT